MALTTSYPSWLVSLPAATHSLHFALRSHPYQLPPRLDWVPLSDEEEEKILAKEEAHDEASLIAEEEWYRHHKLKAAQEDPALSAEWGIGFPEHKHWFGISNTAMNIMETMATLLELLLVKL